MIQSELRGRVTKSNRHTLEKNILFFLSMKPFKKHPELYTEGMYTVSGLVKCVIGMQFSYKTKLYTQTPEGFSVV